jgi:hypothetical protein
VGWSWSIMDDTIREVHGYQKQAAAFGYSKVRGPNALIVTVTGQDAAPVIAEASLARERALRCGRRPPPDPGAEHRPPGDTGAAGADPRGLGVLHARERDTRSVTGHGSRSRSRSGRPFSGRSRGLPSPRGHGSSTRTRSETPRPANGSATPRSPKPDTPRSCAGRRPSTLTAAWSCVG